MLQERWHRKHSSWNWIEAVSCVLGARDEGWRNGGWQLAMFVNVAARTWQSIEWNTFLSFIYVSQPWPNHVLGFSIEQTDSTMDGRMNDGGVPYGRGSEKALKPPSWNSELYFTPPSMPPCQRSRVSSLWPFLNVVVDIYLFVWQVLLIIYEHITKWIMDRVLPPV